MSASEDGKINLWDAAAGELQKTFNDEMSPYFMLSVAFSPDGKQIAMGYTNDIIRLWDTTADNIQVRTFTGGLKYDNTVSFSSHGEYITSGPGTEITSLWDIDVEGKVTVRVSFENGVSHMAFSTNGKQIAIVSKSRNDTIKLQDSMTGEVQKEFTGDSGAVKTLAFSPDGKRKLQHDLTTYESSIFDTDIAFSPDSKQIALGSMDQTIRLWDTITGNARNFKTIPAHSSSVTALAFSPDGKHIVSASLDAKIKIWDTIGNLQKTFTGHTDKVTAIAFSLDGQQVASGSEYGTVKISDITTDSQRAFEYPSGTTLAVAFSLDVSPKSQKSDGHFGGRNPKFAPRKLPDLCDPV
ncbi:Beta-TrCP [Orbilia brochopaga]|nr:Beta-TrCP [Drechslerella brochopaga]